MNRQERRAGKIGKGPSANGSASAGLLAEAMAHHQAGRLGQAEQLYRQILAADPRHADALNLLGVLAGQAGRSDIAVDLISQAIAVNGKAEPFHANLGLALQNLGRLDEAIRCYRRAIALNARSVQAYNNLGLTLRELKRFDEAVACYRKLLSFQPASADAHNNLGLVLLDLAQGDDAAACFRQAIALRPAYPEACYNLANSLHSAGRKAEAVTYYQQSIQLRPDQANAYNNLGLVLQELGRLEEAAACLHKAISLRPQDAKAHNNLGLVMLGLNRLDDAVACCRQAIALQADNPEAYNNLGNAFNDLGRFDEAVAAYGQAIAQRPDFAEAHNNLGTLLHLRGQLDQGMGCYRQAIALQAGYAKAHYNLGLAFQEQEQLAQAADCYRQAITLQPDYPDAHTNLAMAMLAQGDFTQGWREYEWRWRTAEGQRVRMETSQPQWMGEAAEGKTLLIHAEQGFGDSLQFCRLVPLAAARSLRVVLAVQKPLLRLMAGLPGVQQVVALGEPLPPYDLHCPMLSLPLALGIDLATLPAATPYLWPEAAQVDQWRQRLAAMPQSGPKIGLAWAGNPRRHLPLAAAVDRRRSIAPDQLAPLLSLPGKHFISLQKDGPAAPTDFPLTDVMAEMTDFADTAALIATLDLVISVDSAVAHLAAALGKPVWLLDRFDPCWRWLRGRDDSPWYPTLRLFRQTKPGDWVGVIDRVVAELRG